MGVARVAEALGHDAKPLGRPMRCSIATQKLPRSRLSHFSSPLSSPPLRLLVGKLLRRVLPLVALVGAVDVEARRARQLRPFAADGEVIAATLVRQMAKLVPVAAR
jgi:hypothetical protein